MKNQKLIDAFQGGLIEHMEELRTLVVGGVGIQQQQLQTLKDQLQAFLNFKDQVFSLELRLCFSSMMFQYRPIILTKCTLFVRTAGCGGAENETSRLQGPIFGSDAVIPHSGACP